MDRKGKGRIHKNPTLFLDKFSFIIVCLRVGLGQRNIHPQVILLIIGVLLIGAVALPNIIKEIQKKAKESDSMLSRVIATYDWEYSSNHRPEDRLMRYWEVLIGKWHKPWNRELESELTRKEKRAIKGLAWAEQPQTINEVGSTFTIQGFDLNYAGVILGPSVKYRNGKVIFDPLESCNEKAIRNRTLSDGTKQKFGEILIQHEVRVLMTRGVNGMYIYACDPELQKALLEAAK